MITVPARDQSRTMIVSYPVANETSFVITCDPPYESEDGGHAQTIITVPARDVASALAAMVQDLDRLAPGQSPMIIEVRRP